MCGMNHRLWGYLPFSALFGNAQHVDEKIALSSLSLFHFLPVQVQLDLMVERETIDNVIVSP